MSYKLDKPYTDDERADFIVLHNYNNRRKIEETDDAIYALEPGEKLENGEIVPDTDYPARQLAEAKAAKLTQNKEAYEAALKSGVAYKNTLFDCDTLAAVRIMGQMVATLNTRRIETLNCGYNTAIEAAQTTAELDAIVISYIETNPSGTETPPTSSDTAH